MIMEIRLSTEPDLTSYIWFDTVYLSEHHTADGGLRCITPTLWFGGGSNLRNSL